MAASVRVLSSVFALALVTAGVGKAGPVRAIVGAGETLSLSVDGFALELPEGTHGPFEADSITVAGGSAQKVGPFGGSILKNSGGSVFVRYADPSRETGASFALWLSLGVLLFLAYRSAFA